MLAMAAPMHYRLVGLPMDHLMLAGMALVPLGVLLAGYGLMPRMEQMRRTPHPDRSPLPFHAADHVPLNREHWKLVTVLTVALAVGVMKPARSVSRCRGCRPNTGSAARLSDSWRCRR
jgi:putative MFS transporter